MMNKLYKVTVEFDMYILAENKQEAKRVAKFNGSDELNNDLASYYFQECTDIKTIPEGDRNSLPYKLNRVNDERTLKEIITGITQQ